MPSSTALGQYLRARRELVRPEDVNIRTVGRRRVAGLRREELAMLAGISPDYYLRLEQGRDNHPSAQVIDALVRAMQLDDDSTAHLHALSQPPAARPHAEGPEQTPASRPTTSAILRSRSACTTRSPPRVTPVSYRSAQRRTCGHH
jgi:transcriptional regulator with XRE-family HTH domain